MELRLSQIWHLVTFGFLFWFCLTSDVTLAQRAWSCPLLSMASVSPPLAPRESIPLAPMHFCVACVALGDIQSAFACVANMAPAFLVARLGAVDVAAAAALTSTLLWLTVTTDVTHCVVRLASSCPLVWAPLSPPLAPL